MKRRPLLFVKQVKQLTIRSIKHPNFHIVKCYSTEIKKEGVEKEIQAEKIDNHQHQSDTQTIENKTKKSRLTPNQEWGIIILSIAWVIFSVLNWKYRWIGECPVTGPHDHTNEKQETL